MNPSTSPLQSKYVSTQNENDVFVTNQSARTQLNEEVPARLLNHRGVRNKQSTPSKQNAELSMRPSLQNPSTGLLLPCSISTDRLSRSFLISSNRAPSPSLGSLKDKKESNTSSCATQTPKKTFKVLRKILPSWMDDLKRFTRQSYGISRRMLCWLFEHMNTPRVIIFLPRHCVLLIIHSLYTKIITKL